MSDHSLALRIAALIKEGLYVDDGALRPCVAGVLNTLWVTARANNIATAIADLVSQEMQARLIEAARGEVVTGEIRSRYGFGETAETLEERMAQMEREADELLRRSDR